MKQSEYQNYSVLMSVYYKENPEFLRKAMNSMWNQTVPTDDFVLVCDGPLNTELNNVISEMEENHHDKLRVFRLEENRGLGNALNFGIRQCKNELVARMDSDDISRPDRCEKQIVYLQNNPETSILGGWIEEFSSTPNEIKSVRAVPENNIEIIKFAQSRNPFNHPSVMVRKTSVLAAGNYQSVRYLQDYYLWVEMLIKGYIGHNLQEPLVWMRADENLYKRRSGKTYRDIQLNLFKLMLDKGFITKRAYLKSVTIRTLSSAAPNWLRKIAFKMFLRK